MNTKPKLYSILYVTNATISAFLLVKQGKGDKYIVPMSFSQFLILISVHI